MPNQAIYNFIGRDKLTKIAQKVKGSMEGVRKKFKSIDKSAVRMGKSIQKAGNKMKDFGKSASFVSAAVGLLGIVSIRQAAKMEQLGVSFEVLTGSAEKGRETLQALKDFTATTPFQMEGVAESGKVLLAFGSTSENLVERLRMLGDLAAGTGKPLKEFALIFGKIQATGKLTGETLQQLSEKGVNLREVFSKKFGMSVEQVVESISKGKFKFAHVVDAMKDMTGEGGKFYKMTQKQSTTAIGLWSTLKDNIGFAAEEIGNVLMEQFNLKEVMTSAIEKIKAFTAGFKEWAQAHPILLKMAIAFGVFLTILGPVIIVIAQFMIAIGGIIAIAPFVAAAWGLMTWPIALILLGIAALVAAIAFVWVYFDEIVGKIAEGVQYVSGLISDIFGDGVGDNVMDIVGLGEINSKSTSDVNVNVAADSGSRVTGIESSTRGKPSFNLGTSMAGF